MGYDPPVVFVVATVIENVDDETGTELAERLEEFDYDEIVPEN